MRAPKILSFILAALVLALLPQGAHAQDLARVYTVSPKEGADLEAAIREHAEWREQNGDPWTWGVYQVVNGENLGDFVIRSGGHSWADFDAYDQSEFAEAAGAHYESTMGPAVGSISNMITVADTAHQRLPESFENIQLYSVITWHLDPERTQDFEEAIDQIHDAIVQTGWPVHYSFVSPVNGTGGPRRSLVLFYEDWAAFEGPETTFDEMMGEVYGDGAAAIFEKFSGSFRWEESFVLRIRPDLSVNLGS